MALQYTRHYSARKTPQSQPVPGRNQVENSAGGYAFELDDYKRLERFLILGVDGPTYYASEQKLVRENAECVTRCLDRHGIGAVDLIEKISVCGRAPKNDPALFALAIAASHSNPAVRQRALEALPQVARIGTHLFHFAEFVHNFRGWGRGLRRALAGWYLDKDADRLAYQICKYRQRDGWSHRDILRLSHPKTADRKLNAVLKYAVDGTVPPQSKGIAAIEALRDEKSEAKVVKTILEQGLTREMVPTQWLTSKAVWEALLHQMPMGAMVRNLGKMTQVGLLKPMSEAAQLVAERLQDGERIRKARLHPLAVLSAHAVYVRGRGVRGSLTWTPAGEVSAALEQAFALAFAQVEPTGKRHMLALDVSGSMHCGEIGGVPGITPAIAAACMSLITAKTEPKTWCAAFTTMLTPFSLNSASSVSDALGCQPDWDFGATDCALPMIVANQQGIEVDVFVVYTDNETWHGSMHPMQALDRYRQQMGIGAKLIVVGLTATEFSIADPADGGAMDVVGFDAAAPSIMRDFVMD